MYLIQLTPEIDAWGTRAPWMSVTWTMRYGADKSAIWVCMDTLVRVDVCRFYCMCIGKRDNCIRMILIPFFGEQMAVGTDWANFQMETAFIRV